MGRAPCDGIANMVMVDGGPARVDEVADLSHKLLKAAGEGDSSAIRSLLHKKANVETRRPYGLALVAWKEEGEPANGLTPLMYAAQGGFAESCQVLLSLGASVHAEDEDGLMPLHFAAQAGCQETCKVLLDYGARRYAQDVDGNTPLQYVLTNEPSSEDRRAWIKLLGPEAAARISPDGAELDPQKPSNGLAGATVKAARELDTAVPTTALPTAGTGGTEPYEDAAVPTTAKPFSTTAG